MAKAAANAKQSIRDSLQGAAKGEAQASCFVGSPGVPAQAEGGNKKR